MTGVLRTSGHLASNGGIRAHSAGSIFPYSIYQQGTFEGTIGYWVLQPNSLRTGAFSTYDEAEAYALDLKSKAGAVVPEPEPDYLYYTDYPDTLYSNWRWRILKDPELRGTSRGTYSSDGGVIWEESSYTMSEILHNSSFVAIGDDPLWQ